MPSATVAGRLAPAVVARSYLDHLAVERGVAGNTLSSYRRDLDRYRSYLAAHDVTSLADVDAGAVSGFLAYLREGDTEHPPLSAASAARGLVAVRGLHRLSLIHI